LIVRFERGTHILDTICESATRGGKPLGEIAHFGSGFAGTANRRQRRAGWQNGKIDLRQGRPHRQRGQVHLGQRWQVRQSELMQLEPPAQLFDRAAKGLLEFVKLCDFDAERFTPGGSGEAKVTQLTISLIEQAPLTDTIQFSHGMHD